MQSPKALKTALHALFVVFIVAGILMKRLFELPEWLPVFHIAALFVLIGISLLSEKTPRRGQGFEGDAEDALAPDEV